MTKTTAADAVASLEEALATLPSEADARAEFFLQWRARTFDMLDRLFPDDHEPARQFKEIEFSPRRLTREDARDAQLKLDAYLAGCAAARTLLESILWRVTNGQAAPGSSERPIQPAVLPDEEQDEAPEPPPEPKPRPRTRAKPHPPPEPEPEAEEEDEEEEEPVRPVAHPKKPMVEAKFSESPVSRAPARNGHLCDPVRSSLARVLAAWDRGDRDMVLVLSAQLLADLTVLARQERFRAAFENVMSRAVPPDLAQHGLETLKNSAPLCVWSMLAAMNEVMK